MTGATHVLVAAATVGLQHHVTGLAPTPWGIVLILVGSLLPDLDGQGTITRPGRWIRRWVWRGWARALDSCVLSLSRWIRSCLGHRGFLHTPICLVLMSTCGVAWGWNWLVFLSWGYATHLAVDLCTVRGIPLFGPLSRKRYRIMAIRTGSPMEAAFALILVASLVCLSTQAV